MIPISVWRLDLWESAGDHGYLRFPYGYYPLEDPKTNVQDVAMDVMNDDWNDMRDDKDRNREQMIVMPGY